MLKMVLLSQQSVREPLAQMQFPVERDRRWIPNAPTETESAKAVRASLNSLTNYCTETATPAFDLITKVDLHPLCTFGASEEEIVDGLDEAVVKRMEAVQEFTGEVQDSLGPNRVEKQLADMTPRSKGRVLSWEPEGIRQITGSYGATEFFQEYLTNWRAAGLFQKLYEELETLISQVKAHLSELLGAGVGLAKDLSALEEKLRLADEEWQALVDHKKLTEEQQLLAEKYLEQLKQQVESAGDRRAALEEACRLAKERYNNAVKMLEETHQRGVAFLELTPATESGRLTG